MFRTSLFENGEARRLFTAFAIIATAFFAFSVLICFLSTQQIETNLVNREYAVAGKLINGGAANSEETVNAFISKSDENNTKTGAEALEKSGYTGNTVDIVLPFLNGEMTQFTVLILIVTLTAFLLFGVTCYFFLYGIYKRIDDAGRKARLISRGDYKVRLNDNAEGAFARMNYAFNEMSTGIKTEFEKLSRERIFLKNLISDISHQLKTPLSALKMYNEIILQEQLSDTVLDFTKKSEEQLERMEWLILGLLKMARVEAGCLQLNMQKNSFRTIVEEAINDFTIAAGEKNIKIVLLGEDDPILKCDSGWLKEALGNIIKNCIQYTPQDGRITAKVEQTPVLISVKISDNGKGIHPDDLPYVFKRFYRGHGSRETGSGIGLSLAKSIVEQMGGTLTAGGEYGSGAEFTFSFLRDVI